MRFPTIQKRQKEVPEVREDYVTKNPCPNPTVVKQLSTRFRDRAGNDAWSYMNQNGLAVFEIMRKADGYGLVSYKDYARVLRALAIRFRDSDGTSTLEYLNSHPTMAKELFQPTEAYKDQMIQRLGPVFVILRRSGVSEPEPLAQEAQQQPQAAGR